MRSEVYWIVLERCVILVKEFEKDRQSRTVKTARGKSELHRAECWITSSEGNLKESACAASAPV
jgi:hypothetical protein